MTLIKIFMEGPEVSLKGSPTVSPTTTAAVGVRALAAEIALFNILLGVIPSPARIRHHQRHEHTTQATLRPAFRPREVSSQAEAYNDWGQALRWRLGTTIRLRAAVVAISTQRFAVSGSACALQKTRESHLN